MLGKRTTGAESKVCRPCCGRLGTTTASVRVAPIRSMSGPRRCRQGSGGRRRCPGTLESAVSLRAGDRFILRETGRRRVVGEAWSSTRRRRGRSTPRRGSIVRGSGGRPPTPSPRHPSTAATGAGRGARRPQRRRAVADKNIAAGMAPQRRNRPAPHRGTATRSMRTHPRSRCARGCLPPSSPANLAWPRPSSTH